MDQSDQTFYSVAAQVIPVLFLVAAVERRLLTRRPPETHTGFVLDLVFVPVVILLMAVGEVATIQALALDENTRLLHVLTVGSLVIAGFAVVVEAISGTFDVIQDRTANVRPEWVSDVEMARAITRGLIGLGVVIVVALYGFLG